jgi:2-keto-4-pentenoate hydratase/2-oxohepta-3-ene-1,7-dioic acid hydratase in catechol pathway
MVFGELARGGVKDDRIVAGQVGLEIGRFLESGDTVELSVDRIGVLKNTVLRQA